MSKLKYFTFDISTPVDMHSSLEGLGGEKKLYFDMLGNLKSMSLDNSIKALV